MPPLPLRVLAAACIAASCSAASAQNLPGRYSVDGRNFDGSSYGGTLTIAADGPVFRLTFADGRTQRGMGIQRGNHLVAAFGPRDCSALGTETLQKQAGPAGQPDGTYDANGRSPTGDTYEGVTTITPRGQTYRVVYKDSGSQQSGVAVTQGNVLGIAYGGPECVVSVYAIGADGTLTGRWADPADTRVGQETVKRAR